MKKLITISVMLIFYLTGLNAQTCFTPVWTGNGLDQMNFYITSATVNGINMRPGDEIGIFDGPYCVGAAVLTQELTGGSVYLAIITSRDDPDTPATDGFIVGHPISFRLCMNGGSVLITDVQVTYSYPVGFNGLFSAGGTAMAQLSGITECTNPPSLTLGSTTGSTCIDSPITVSGNTFGGSATQVTITENGSGTLSQSLFTSSPFEFTYNPATGDEGNTVTIILTTDNPSGDPCSAATSTYILVVNPLPGSAGTITGTATVCQGQTGVTYTVPAIANAATYSWSYSGTGATINGSTNSITINFSASATSGNLTVYGVNSCGNGTLSANYPVTVNATNTVSTASSSPTLCINTALTPITHTTTGATGIGTATGLPGGITAAWASNTITISGTPNTSGTFNYNIPLTGGCGTVSATGTITVNPLPSAAGTISGSATVCQGQTGVTYTVPAIANAATYSWSYSGTGATINGSTNSITINFSASATSGNLTVYGVNSCGNGTLSANYPVTVNATNTVSAASSSPTLCINTALTPITHTTTGATGIGTATGLPGGVTAAWASNTITISGTPNTSGTFNYSIPLTGGCGTVSATGTITVNPLPSAAGTISGSATVCQGQTNVTYTVPAILNATTYSWSYSGTGATITGNTSSITVSFGATATSGNLTVYGVNSCGNGTVSANYPVTVNATNTVSAASSSPTLCINTALTPITHTITGATGIGTATGLPGGLTAAWASNTITISGTPNTSGTFNYSIPLTGGCGTVSATGTITVNPLPGAAGTITGSSTVCQGQSGVAYSVPAITNATSYSWSYSGTGATITGNTRSITVSFGATATSGNLTVYGVNSCGNGTVSANYPVTVNATNTVSAASSSPTLCINTALTPITHTTTGATGIGTATGLPGGVTATWASNTITISGTPNTSGTFNYSIPLTGGCGTVSATGIITVNPLPSAAGTISGATTVCQGQSGVAYSVPAITNASSCTWSYSGTGVTITGNTSSITVSFGATATSGNLTVYGVNSCGNGTVSANYPITVNPLPGAAGAITGTATVCQGQTGVTYSVPAISNATTYSWSYSGTGATITGNSNSITVSFAANATSGNLTVRGTNSCGNGTISANYPVTVNTTNTVSAASSSLTLCINTALTPITHTTTGATGIGTPTGLPGGVTAAWASNTITISGTPNTSGTFNYSIPLTGGCGTVSATGTIYVTPANTVSAASSSPTLCINTALTPITHTTTGATGIGTPTGLPGGVTAAWASNTITISGTPNTSGTFNYNIPLTGGCGTVSATGTIHVTPANTITLTSGVGTNNQTVCAGTAITNITYSTTGATGATISGLPSGVTGNWASNMVTISGTPGSAGVSNYTVTLTGGCGTVTANGTITVNALPVTSAITGSATPACSGTGYVYSVTNTVGSSYAWTVPAGASFTGQGSNSITVNFGSTNGNITVAETNASNCTGTTRTLAISLQGCGLDANFEGTPQSICVGSAVTFTNTSTGTTGSTTYSWNFGSGASPATATGIGPHTVTYTTTGQKTVSLTITEGASNIETKTNYITVNPVNTVTLTSGTGTNNQTVCVNTPITTITYSTTGATGASFSGFPSGLTVGWSSNVVTISGTPTASGAFNYTVTLTGGCGNVTANGTINVSATNTAGTASSTPTVCINTALTPITHTTTGAIGIGTPAGLPGGVTAVWASNTITISGTPNTSGTFTYSIPLMGGCGTVSATGTIYVTPANTVGTASSSPTLCINTTLTPITHTTTGATGIGTPAGLPGGVTAAWASNTITISGTPNTSGTFTYSIPLTGGCGTVSAAGTIYVTPANTVSSASSSPTLCINTALTPVTHTTTGAAGIGTPAGLPGGVTADWASNTITISGTPNTSGTFNYSIPLTGGCGTVSATGTIHVTPANTIILTSGVGTNNQTVCANTAIKTITYSTTGATGATFSGLPTGINGNWSSNVITISGTPTIAATSNYTVTLTGGCGAVTANGTITVNSLPVVNAGTDITIPNGTSTLLTGTVTGAGTFAYSWTPASLVLSPTNLSTGTVNLSSTTIFTLTATSTSTNCSNSDAVTVTITGGTLSASATATPNAVCAGGTVQLNANASGGSGVYFYNWTSSPVGFTSANASPTVVPTANTTYYVSVNDGYSTVNSHVAVTVTPIPSITGTTSASRCGPGILTLGATASAGTINWYSTSTGGTSLGTGTSFVTPSLGSTTTYYVDATYSGCTTTSRTPVTATINVIPTITGTTSASRCGQGTVTLGATSSVGTVNWYSVNAGGTLLASGTTFTTPSINATTTYYVDATYNGCTTGTRTPVTATVLIIPSITSSSPASRCGPGSVILGANASSGTINWYASSTGGTALGTGTSFTTPSLTATTTYYIDATDNGCTTLTRTPVTATINPIPVTPVINITQPSCSVATGTITITSPTGTGMTYSIDGSTYTNTTGIFSSVVPGNYTVTARSSAGCTSSGTLITINTQPPTPVVPNQTASVATGGTFTITPTGVPAGTTYTWPAPTYTNGVTGGVAQLTGAASISGTLYIISGAGTAVYTVTPKAGACAGNTFTVTVTVTSTCVPVTVSSYQANASMCAGSSASLSVTAGGTSPFTYQWQFFNGTVWSNVANGMPSGASYTDFDKPILGISGISALGSYQYRCSISNCSGGSTVNSGISTLTVNPLPSAPAIGVITQPTCTVSTGSVVLENLPAGNWIINPGNISGSTSSVVVGGLIPGSYSFSVTNSNGCTSSLSSAITINKQPAVPTKPIISTVTQPTCVVSTGSVGLSGLPYTGTWTLKLYPGGVESTGTGSVTTLATLTPGTYNFSVTNEEGCTSPLSDNAVIKVQPVTPSAPLIGTITQPTYTVPTGSVILNGLPASGNWTITSNPESSIIVGSGVTHTVTGLEPGTYVFSVTNADGCISLASEDVVINARPGPPIVVIHNPSAICSDQTADLTVLSVTEGSDENLIFTYWVDAAATVPYETPAAAKGGTYYIKGTTTAGYFTIKPVVVTEDKMPEANAGTDQILDYVFGTTLDAEVPEYGNGLWSLVSGTGDFANSSVPITHVSNLALGDNVFRWTVTNGVCPPAIDEVVVRVNDITIPTLITPNGDGRNDYFVLKGLEETLGKTELVIFDRRGLKVFESHDYDNSWNGLDFNNNPLPEDTYFYFFRSSNGRSSSGYIVILR